MGYRMVGEVKVWGEPLENAIEQAEMCALTADRVALMADHHLGYSQPIGGVVAYRGKVSPSGVGYDIACGNKAVKLDADPRDIQDRIAEVMDAIWSGLSFGVGRTNTEPVGDPLFNDPAWDIEAAGKLKGLAQSQLGTIGSGNHYIDVFLDESETNVWVGVHFGSRGPGHKLATHFIKAGGGRDGINASPTLLDADSQLGQEYIACMTLAGRFAYAGRDWVCDRVANILGAKIVDEVHNHHNFAWEEVHDGERYWVVRKGATPNFPDQRSFIGGSMGDISVIVEGAGGEESEAALHSTVHGAGRVMSRTQAAGKRRWRRVGKKRSKRQVQVSEGRISQQMMEDWVQREGVVLRGAGTDESPHCYKRLPDVLEHHRGTFKGIQKLRPIGVAMAGAMEHDPYRD